MKKYLKEILFAGLVFAFCFLLFGSVQAQRFDAHISGGMNMSQIDGDGAGRYNHVGLRAGVGTSFALGGDNDAPWRMVVELAFAQKGSATGDGTFNRTISLDYVEIPLMLSYNMLEGRLRLAAGVAPAVLVGARVTDDGVDNQLQADNYKSLDLLPLATLVRYRLAGHLCLEGRYESSMLSITKQNATGTYRLFRENKGTFSRVLTIGLTYQF